ncbi:hypothetical protein [Frigoribacterium sp. 9N]|uniref:hypothetical protein n=1 Tax=Frigoribacterium sp. 9N TaxID=2653144 RepID=UPI00135ADA78|nr:hypothetical protein [Frigoribacterium sp. 9N]
MANRNHLSPKSIVDKNGKRTTVHVANSIGSSSPDAAKKARERQDAAIAEAARRAAGAVAVLETPKRDERGFDAGVHEKTGELWSHDGLLADGRNIKTALGATLNGGYSPRESRNEVYLRVDFQEGAPLVRAWIDPNRVRATETVWQAINDPEQNGVKDEFASLRLLSADDAMRIAMKLNLDAESNIGGSYESDEPEILERLSSAWAHVSESSTGMPSFEVPKSIAIEYIVEPVALVKPADVRDAWLSDNERYEDAFDYEVPFENQATFDESVEEYIREFEKLNDIVVDEDLREYIEGFLQDWDIVDASEEEVD